MKHHIEPKRDVDLATRTDEERRLAIREVLTPGPLLKWEFQARLHEPESVILRTLKKMRDDGEVKVVGKDRDRRAWALAAWREPTAAVPRAPNEETAVLQTKVAKTESWWATPHMWQDRAAFQQEWRRRARERSGAGR